MEQEDALAAAVAAAAELAKNGGAYLFNAEAMKSVEASHHDVVSMMTLPSSNPPPPSLDSHRCSSSGSTTSASPHHHHHHHEDGRGDSSNNWSEDEDDDDEEQDDKDNEEGAERRMARSRERNREHARRTRLRKKAQLEALQCKVKGLQAESRALKQSLEECNIASILVGLSSGDGGQDRLVQALLKEASKVEENDINKVATGKRKRFVSDISEKQAEPLKLNIDGRMTLIGGGRTHINWKTGVYSDENGLQRQLTQDQLESLR